MDETAIRLRCLELAIEQVRREAPATNFRESVADTQTWFYNRIVPPTEEVTPKPGRQKDKDKSAIFT